MRHTIQVLLIVSLIATTPFQLFSFIILANNIHYEYVPEQFNSYNIFSIKNVTQHNNIINSPIILISISILLASLFYTTFKYPTKIKQLTSNRSNKYVLYLAIILIIIFSTIIVVKFPFTKSEDVFFNFGVLDTYKNINNYFPNNNEVPLNKTMKWYLYLGNNMHTSANITIKVKIVDSVELLPNSTSYTSSPAEVIWSQSYHLNDNETKIPSFNWSINKISTQDNITYTIEKMTVNKVVKTLHLNVDKNANPRIVFELYIYDSKNKAYSFQWESSGVKRCSWCQVLFSLPTN